jgi:peptide-methionine (S)-S-oxide reductase
MKKAASLLLTLSLALTAACQQPALATENAVNAPAAARLAAERPGLKTAIFAGGCYWGIEGVFSHIIGVTSVVSGFHGGAARTAQYERVSDGNTGHAESVRVTYDPTKIRYDQLLRIFFSVGADPTQLNRQGPDSGTQYRSALVPMSDEQRLVATAYLAQLRASGIWRGPIVTRLESYQRFYPAEAYHQDFMAKNPQHPYILAWDAAKVAALKRLYPGFYKAAFTTG